MYSFNGVIAMSLQFLLYPPLARELGARKLLAISAALYPIIYLSTPYSVTITSKTGLMAYWFFNISLKSITGVFAFTSSTIMITNTASSIRVLGTLNGFATSVAALGRAMGPSFFGFLFTRGQKSWVTVTPWYGLTCVAVAMWYFINRLEDGDATALSREEEEEEDVVVDESAMTEEEFEELCERRQMRSTTRRLSMSSINEQ